MPVSLSTDTYILHIYLTHPPTNRFSFTHTTTHETHLTYFALAPRSGSSKISSSTASLASISQTPSVSLTTSACHPFDSDPAPKNQCWPRFPSVKFTALLRSLASPRISHTTSSRASSPGPASRATTPRGGEPTSPRSTTPRFGNPRLGRRPSLRRAWSSADSEEGSSAKGNAVIDAECGFSPTLPPRDGSRAGRLLHLTPLGKKEADKKRHAGCYNGVNRHVHTSPLSHVHTSPLIHIRPST
jgi:hypothetical protein